MCYYTAIQVYNDVLSLMVGDEGLVDGGDIGGTGGWKRGEGGKFPNQFSLD